MHGTKPPGVVMSPQRIKSRSRVSSPYAQAQLPAWTPPGTGSTKLRMKMLGAQNEGYPEEGSVKVESKLWQRALAITGVGVGGEASDSSLQTPQMPQLYDVVKKATQAQRGADKAISSLNKSAKQYATKEEMYLELQGLKKAIRMSANERDNIKSRLRRTEEELSRRDKELEDMLSGSGGLSQQELVRTLGDKERTGQGQGTGGKTLILSLKRQIYTLQKTLRDREHALSKLQDDSRTMDVREMQVQLEVCTQEILRLTEIIDSYEGEVTDHFKDQINSLHTSFRQVEKINQKLEGEKRELTERLQELEPFIPPKELFGIEEEKRSTAKKYLGLEYVPLLDRLASLELERRSAKESEERTKSKFKERLEGKELMLLEMVEKENSLKDEIGALEKESHGLSVKFNELSHQYNEMGQKNEQFKEQVSNRDGELNTLRARTDEIEKEKRHLSDEIITLSKWKSNEMLALANARKLQGRSFNPFIRSSREQKLESSAQIIQQHWSKYKASKRQKSYSDDQNWALGTVTRGFIKYKEDTEALNSGDHGTVVAEPVMDVMGKRESQSDATTQTEETVLISLLKELKERDELSWALDTIQLHFEEFFQDKLTLEERDGGKEEGIKTYMSVEEAMLLYNQSKPED